VPTATGPQPGTDIRGTGWTVPARGGQARGEDSANQTGRLAKT